MDLSSLLEKENLLYLPETLIKIIQVPKLWSEYPELKLIISLRLLGTDEEIRNYVKEDVDALLADAVTVDNFETSLFFDDLVHNYNQWMTQAIKIAVKAPGHKLTSELPDYEEVKVEDPIVDESEPLMESVLDENVPIKFVKKTVKRPKKAVDLKAKIDQLADNKVLDVSLMNEFGVGLKTIVYNPTKHHDKFFNKRKTLMSDNYKSFMYAIKLLPNGMIKHQKDIKKAQAFFGIVAEEEEKEDEEEKEEEAEEPVEEVKEARPVKPSPKRRTKVKKTKNVSETESEEEKPKPKKKTPKKKKESSSEEEKPKKKTPKRAKKESSSEEEKPKKKTPKKSKKESSSEEEKPKKKTPKRTKKDSSSEEERPKKKTPKKSKK